jgi:hypothetical protein
MTGYTREQQERLDELAARKREIDLRADILATAVKQRMRETGEPVREDYPSRGAYRAAHSLWRKRHP